MLTGERIWIERPRGLLRDSSLARERQRSSAARVALAGAPRPERARAPRSEVRRSDGIRRGRVRRAAARQTRPHAAPFQSGRAQNQERGARLTRSRLRFDFTGRRVERFVRPTYALVRRCVTARARRRRAGRPGCAARAWLPVRALAEHLEARATERRPGGHARQPLDGRIPEQDRTIRRDGEHGPIRRHLTLHAERHHRPGPPTGQRSAPRPRGCSQGNVPPQIRPGNARRRRIVGWLPNGKRLQPCQIDDSWRVVR